MRRKPFNKKRFWRIFWMTLGYGILLLFLFTAISFAWFAKDLPTPTKIAGMKPAQSTKIYDRTGQNLLYETGEQKRTIIESGQMSNYLKQATVATEDTNFYKHHGINVFSMLSAVRDKLLGRTAILRGGSTITQQYVKNALLTSNRSIIRKVKEAILAVELEFMYSKDQILTMYLNEIPYGNATAGAEAGAKMYYNKSAKDLTLAEAATLAAIPKAPTYYSPYGTHVDKLITRRDYVLDQMVKNGMITGDEAKIAKTEDTTTLGVDLKPRRDSMQAPHFAMYVLEQIANKYGEDVIQKEGLSIITTLDMDKQRAAEQAITDGVPKNTKYGASNAALVSVDPKSGQILAMVGSKDYYDTSIDGNVNVTDSLRQPGSSFKPFAYATAFKSPNYFPGKIIYDMTTNFGGTPPYIPRNYNGRTNGPVTMRQALSNSLNIPAVKVMGVAGIDNVLATAKDMGITTLNQRDRYGLSLVLGSGEVKPVEMAGAFSVFATGGMKSNLTPILKITDSANKVLFEYNPDKNKPKQVLDPQVAYEISNILSDNSARSLVFGTRSALYFPDRTVAAKTGTTSDFKDAWTVGFTPSLSTAVWVGNNDSTAMKSGADGSVVAAPIFHNYLVKALAGTPNEDFAKPDGIVQATVEKYSGKLPNDQSKETVTDIFARWQVPTDKDNVNQLVNICKGTDLLAPASLPAELTEQKLFVNIHSEKPDNPNWEAPVLAWATSVGWGIAPPKDYCDPNALVTQVIFTSPIEGATVSGNQDVSVATQGTFSITKIEFFIDGVSIGEVSAEPYTTQFNFKSMSEGAHRILAVATDSRGIATRAEIGVTVTDTTGPTITHDPFSFSGSGNTSLSSLWYTDEPATTSFIYYPESTPNAKTTLNISATPSLAHNISVPNLTAGGTYNYTFEATNDKNISSTSLGTFTVPLQDIPVDPLSVPVLQQED